MCRQCRDESLSSTVSVVGVPTDRLYGSRVDRENPLDLGSKKKVPTCGARSDASSHSSRPLRKVEVTGGDVGRNTSCVGRVEVYLRAPFGISRFTVYNRFPRLMKNDLCPYLCLLKIPSPLIIRPRNSYLPLSGPPFPPGRLRCRTGPCPHPHLTLPRARKGNEGGDATVYSLVCIE